MTAPRRLAAVLLCAVAAAVAALGLPAAAATVAAPAGAGPTALVVSAGAPAGALFPEPATGYASPEVGAVALTVGNPGPTAVRVHAVRLSAVGVRAVAGRVCPAGSVLPARTGPVDLAEPVRLPAGAVGVPVRVPGALRMPATAGPGCQGAAVDVEVTVVAAPA
ncbi:hypothetical protein [Geodermatophilus sp. DSM 44513]|uniref:hypothetical protein n=1 Tax=Geodermatophilus sp. DSM 44513 TaxID=1528104 RepID=UPI00127C5455|nr:hypothetical protein [Geodermatophilus sp. DSM 44513]WNV75331.1 hypothetical protein RTG05_20505 [Geodermatophilus sp. DSM 44513]